MNRKDRAINLGLKINSLKGNFSVAKSVIDELNLEITKADIDEEDKKRLLILYSQIVEDLKSIVSPSTEERSRLNQQVEDLLTRLKNGKSYQEIESMEGLVVGLEELVRKNKILKKEHKAAITHRVESVRDKYKARVGYFLKKNHDQLRREIITECDCDCPFHVSVVVKKYNDIVKTTPLFTDDRHDIQALLDTNWQKSSRDIKERKKNDKIDRDYDE